MSLFLNENIYLFNRILCGKLQKAAVPVHELSQKPSTSTTIVEIDIAVVNSTKANLIIIIFKFKQSWLQSCHGSCMTMALNK